MNTRSPDLLVRSAFYREPPEIPDSLDPDSELYEKSVKFWGKEWEELKPELFEDNMFLFQFLPHEPGLYFLGACFWQSVVSDDEMINTFDVLFSGIEIEEKNRPSTFGMYLRKMNQEMLSATRAFLEWRAKRFVSFREEYSSSAKNLLDLTQDRLIKSNDSN